MLEVDTSSSVRVPSSRRGTALSIATTDPLHSRGQLLLEHGFSNGFIVVQGFSK
jgi:hypothetical protein